MLKISDERCTQTQIRNVCRRTLDHLTVLLPHLINPVVGATSTLAKKSVSVKLQVISKQMVGELQCRPLMATAATGSERGRLLYILDRTSSRRILFENYDTCFFKPVLSVSLSRQAADGSSIMTYFQKLLTLDLGLRRCFP